VESSSEQIVRKGVNARSLTKSYLVAIWFICYCKGVGWVKLCAKMGRYKPSPYFDRSNRVLKKWVNTYLLQEYCYFLLNWLSVKLAGTINKKYDCYFLSREVWDLLTLIARHRCGLTLGRFSGRMVGQSVRAPKMKGTKPSSILHGQLYIQQSDI